MFPSFRRPGEVCQTVQGPELSSCSEGGWASSCVQLESQHTHTHTLQTSISPVWMLRSLTKSSSTNLIKTPLCCCFFSSLSFHHLPPPPPPPSSLLPPHLYQVVCRSAAWQELVFCDGSVQRQKRCDSLRLVFSRISLVCLPCLCFPAATITEIKWTFRPQQTRFCCDYMNQAHFLNKRLKFSRIPTLNQEPAGSVASGSSLQPHRGCTCLRSR